MSFCTFVQIPFRRRLHAAAATSLAAFAALGVALLAGCSKPEPAPEPVRAVKVVTVGASAIDASSELAGDVRARVEQRLAFRVGGKLTARAVDVGQTVVAGQLLAQIDPSDLALSAQAAAAQVSAAQTQADLAAADFKRFKDLRDQGFISTAQLDQREATLKANAAQLEQAKAGARVQGNQASYAQLRATSAGVVVATEAEVGQVVSAGSPVLRIATAGPRDAVFAVPEAQLKAVAVGQTVLLRLATGAALEGRVREIAAAADPSTRTYAAKVAVQSDGASAPALGATVYGRFAAAAAAAPAQMKLPTSALRQAPAQATKTVAGDSAVWVFDTATSTVRTRSVQILAGDGHDVVIAPGALAAGERVVVAGVHVLQEGQKVTLWAQPALPAVALAPASAAKAAP